MTAVAAGMNRIDPYLIPALDGVAYGLLVFVAASGLVFCFGVANILNLAHGLLYAIGGYTAAALLDGGWASLALALAVGVLAAAAVGVLLAGLLTPVAAGNHLSQALLTFGVALAGGSLLVAGFGPDNPQVQVPAALEGSVMVAGHRYAAYRLVFIVVAAVLAAALYLVVRRTRAGMLVRAAVDDPEMVACLGVSPAWIRAGVLAAAGALAGAAGVLGAPIIGPGTGTADTVLLLSLVVVVLGGLGSMAGTLLAALAIGEIQTLGVALLPSAAPFLLFAAMAAVLAVRARGLTGRWRAA
ncbi:branched-subunit amino acid ABC-type transport system permease component [Micromonospora vinacea]|uniref:Branched-subunit amino acid ABC-type transport system permease component n=1 Tax=Micromonospora vinacea TaxID=709878 RepID=A0ABS0K6F5_9ACTN|nr:branched-chain amino acid ABC transporter permease [Micromonospora vinacea]MBG6104056.1 branched-subunit amino acid ABC-type transport system permease component [Micromonospora vinacea]WTA70225.1 branched-chain amino acid ABC transporter permease [Micromonospora sp. NBC_00855]